MAKLLATIGACAFLLLVAGCGGNQAGSEGEPRNAPPQYEPTAPPETPTYEVGEPIELTPAGTQVPPTPVTVTATSVETHPSLERDPLYGEPGAEPGPFAVARFDFTNRSENTYVSATEVFNFLLQTSETERSTTGNLSTFEIQPEETQESANAAPGTTREVVVIFDVEEGEEPRFLVFQDQASFGPAARVEVSEG